MLIGIAPAAMRQLSLLAQHGAGDKSQRLMQAMDKLNQTYGRNTVMVFAIPSIIHITPPKGCNAYSNIITLAYQATSAVRISVPLPP
jgi:uncharacterized membrane protein YjjP (DUF1212 family)